MLTNSLRRATRLVFYLPRWLLGRSPRGTPLFSLSDVVSPVDNYGEPRTFILNFVDAARRFSYASPSGSRVSGDVRFRDGKLAHEHIY